MGRNIGYVLDKENYGVNIVSYPFGSLGKFLNSENNFKVFIYLVPSVILILSYILSFYVEFNRIFYYANLGFIILFSFFLIVFFGDNVKKYFSARNVIIKNMHYAFWDLTGRLNDDESRALYDLTYKKLLSNRSSVSFSNMNEADADFMEWVELVVRLYRVSSSNGNLDRVRQFSTEQLRNLVLGLEQIHGKDGTIIYPADYLSR